MTHDYLAVKVTNKRLSLLLWILTNPGFAHLISIFSHTNMHFTPFWPHELSSFISHTRNPNAPHCQTHPQQLVLCVALSFPSAEGDGRLSDDWV